MVEVSHGIESVITANTTSTPDAKALSHADRYGILGIFTKPVAQLLGILYKHRAHQQEAQQSASIDAVPGAAIDPRETTTVQKVRDITYHH